MIRRRRFVVALGALTVALAGFQIVRGGSSGDPRRAAVRHPDPTTTAPVPPVPPSVPALRPGSDPTVLPARLLIADGGNDRLVEIDPRGGVVWEFPRPGDLAPGQTFRAPDRAFFSSDGRFIVATQTDESVVSVIDVAKRRIAWRYGTPGVRGSSPGRLSGPSDAIMLRDRRVVVADTGNCRVLVIPFGARTPSLVFGDGRCRAATPGAVGVPVDVLPTRSGEIVVTDAAGDRIDELSLDGRVLQSVHVPRVAAPSDANELSPGVFLTVDGSDPGAVVVFDGNGRARWRFAPTGADALHRPSQATPLPDGDFLVTDAGGSRVVVVDPSTNAIVWQYGQTGHPGSGPGYLRLAGGVDLAPPFSYLRSHTAG